MEFYRDLFGWKIEKSEGMDYYLIDTGSGRGIAGGIAPLAEGTPRYVSPAAEVEDLRGYLVRAVELGGQAVMPPTPIPGVGAYAVFLDPEGNPMRLFRAAR